MRRTGWHIHKLNGIWWVCQVNRHGKCKGGRVLPSGAEAIAAFARGGK